MPRKPPPIHRQGAPPGAPNNAPEKDGMESEPLQPIGEDSGSDAHSDTHSETDTGSDADSDLDTLSNRSLKKGKVNNKFCWFPIRTSEYFDKLTQLNNTYARSLEDFEKTVGMDNFDKEMLETMLKTRSIAERALQRFRGEPNLIPAGINLGGYQMMRMPQSVLFFHRLKLRNNTRFRVNYLHNDLKKMRLTARLSLNDLHLAGHYERTITVTDLSVLFYRPTYGQVEFLLKDVTYGMDGYYRLLHDRLYIENVVSTLKPKEILMRYLGENNTTPIRLGNQHIKEYLLRLRNDLDRWLKDYFNDFLMFFGLGGAKTNAKVQEYDNEKALVLNQFADKVLSRARWRLRQLNASSIKIPRFSLFAVNGLEIKLRDGLIRGLDSMYRRAVSTGSANEQLAELVTVVGFSNLKVEYRYDASTKTVGTPPLSGLLVLNGDELTSRLKVLTAREKDVIELTFQYWQEAKPQSLTIEGPANRLISNFKHLLEHHIVSIMSTSLIHYIEQLGTLTRCRPSFIGKDDPMYKNIDSDEFDSFEDSGKNETTPLYPKTTEASTNLPYNADAESDKSGPNNQDDKSIKKITTDQPQGTPDEPSDEQPQDPKYPSTQEPSVDESNNTPQPGPSDDETKNPPQPVPSDNESYNPPQPGPSDDETKNPPQPGPSDNESYNPPPPGPSDDETTNQPQPGPSDNEPFDFDSKPILGDDEAQNPPKPGPSDDEPYDQPQPGPSDDETKNPPQPGPSDNETTNAPQPGPTHDELPELSQNSEENRNPSDSKGSPAPTYIVSKNESVELEFPSKSGSKKKETMILNLKEKFSLTRLKNKGGRKVG